MRCTWWQRQSRWCKRLILLLLIIVCVILYGGHTVLKIDSCSEEESQQLIQDLCKLYSKGEVAGSFCSHLCEKKQLKYDRCTNYRGGKVVIFMTCENVCVEDETVKVVFKTKALLSERERLPRLFGSKSKGRHGRFKQLLNSFIQSSVYLSLGVNITDLVDPLTFVWGWDFERYVSSHENVENASFIAGDSLYSLITQHEYALMKLYADQIFMPKIYGTCGPGYFVEFTETLRTFEYKFLSASLFTWKDRVKLALKLIDLTYALDTNFHKPLHLCDIKPDNFGLRYKSQVSLIDVDCAFFEDKLLEQFKATKCYSHDDCDFFDCRGFCDTSANTCQLNRTNNNIQSICEDVFIGISPKFRTGLLRDPPLDSRVAVFDAIEKCAYPGKSSWDLVTRLPVQPEAVENLKAVLKNSVRD